jgi:ATP-binding cassette subfamily G (WHITE) protein 2 (SNQ2)
MDVHEGTATVREAMRFSANLRQPFNVHQHEKDVYVEEIIELLELQDLADALVMTLGVEGTSVAWSYSHVLSFSLARKRLTIGVELAAKPELLLFLDEVRIQCPEEGNKFKSITAHFWTRRPECLESRSFLEKTG